MTTKEQIFVQNWVEQFRGQLDGSRWRRGGSWCTRRSVDEVYDATLPACINWAFPWEETREPHTVWQTRYSMFCSGFDSIR